MKYKLIKEYPCSIELGTIVEINPNSESCFYRSEDKRWGAPKKHVEDNHDYWEKVEENIWWCVWKKDYIQEGVELFKAWTPYKIECVPAVWETERHYFKTEEEAAKFVIYNKPCLSINEIGSNIPEGTLFRLISIAKSKI